MKKLYYFKQLWLPLLLCLLPLFSHAQSVKISGFTSSGTYNGYPQFVITGEPTSISISSTSGQFDYVFIDDKQIDYNTSSYWSSYTLKVANYKDGEYHKLHLRNSNTSYGTCYFKIKVPSLYYSLSGKSVDIAGADKDIVVANIPSECEFNGQTYPVTSISSRAFENCKNLTSVTIPNSVTYIGDDAFYGCSSLTKAEFASIEHLCSIRFGIGYDDRNCYANPLYYAHHLYVSGEEVTNLVIPNSITSIKDYTFQGCSGLTSVEIPNSVTNIGKFAFYGTGLTSITIPESVTFIGGYAFSDIQSLTDVYFYAKNCSTRGRYDGCPDSDSYCWTVDPILSSSVKNVVIGQDVTKIPNGIFRWCKELTYVNLPEGITYIGEDAFYGCNGLQIVNFASLESLCNMTISSNPIALAKTSLIGGKTIADIVIPNTITTIPSNVFNGCNSLASVVIPASVTTIKDMAFFSCSNLTSVYCLSDVPPTLEYVNLWDDDLEESYVECRVFSYTGATLFVPRGKVSAYQSSSWSRFFKNIVELDNILTVEIIGNGVVLNDLAKIDNGSKYIGSDFEFYVLPDNGNVVSSITFEGQDITSSLVNHKLTISDFKGDGDGVLKVEFAPEADATLVVKGADTHAIRHTYKEGTEAVVELQPEEGWKIHSVTYNGEDVTDRLENNVFMTEPLHGENNLNMVLVSNSTVDIEAVSEADSQVRISVNRNTVSIIGLDDDEPVSVYDVSGKTIYTGFDRSVTLKSGEAYILTTPSKTFKVAI